MLSALNDALTPQNAQVGFCEGCRPSLFEERIGVQCSGARPYTSLLHFVGSIEYLLAQVPQCFPSYSWDANNGSWTR